MRLSARLPFRRSPAAAVPAARPVFAGQASHAKAPRIALAAMAMLSAIAAGAGLGGLQTTFAAAVVLLVLLPWIVLGIGYLPTTRREPGPMLFHAFLVIFCLYFIWPQGAFIAGLKLPIKHPQKIMHLAMVGCWLLVLMKNEAIRQRLVHRLRDARVMFWCLLAFCFLSFASCFISIAPLYSLFRWFQDLLWTLTIFFVVLSLPATKRHLMLLIGALVGTAALISALTIPESILKKNLFERFNNVDTVDPFMAQSILEAKFRLGGYRAQASFDHPLLLAEFLLVLTPFFLFLAPVLARRSRLLLAILPLCLVGLLSTRSRIALVAGAAAALFVGGVWLFKRISRSSASLNASIAVSLATPFFLTLLIVAAYQVGNLVLGRNQDEFLSSLARFEMLEQSLDLIAQAPFMGYGLGLGGYTLGFAGGSGGMTLDNHYLMVALDSGVPALLALLAMQIEGLRRSWRLIQSEDPDLRRFGMACASALLCVIMIKAVLGTGLNNNLMFAVLALPFVARSLYQPTEPAAGEARQPQPAVATDRPLTA